MRRIRDGLLRVICFLLVLLTELAHYGLRKTGRARSAAYAINDVRESFIFITIKYTYN